MAPDLKYKISSALQNFSQGKPFDNALQFFQSLGYPTPLQSPLNDPTWQGLKNIYLLNKTINEKTALTDEWKYFNILFQLTDEAMRNQVNMFSSGRVDNAIMNSFLFLVLELKEEHYTKTQLSQITREINKIFAMPAIILFKTGGFLTLSVIHRRIHKKDESKDVLEKVTLIKDISITNPHRAHIEILFDLSFNELQKKHGFTNFVDLHKAWEKTLDIKELNKRFFKELFNWYHWAVRSVRFPNKVADDKDDTQFNQEAVIRLLTRLIFVWFIKEKGLVPEELFDPRIMKDVLKHFNPDSKDNAEYYRAILQNLFFATLNTPMDRDITDANREEKRGFIDPGMKAGKANPHYTDQTRYRYKEYFVHEEKALELFSTIPFLNGGLFECLDYPPDDGQPELRIDGFSTRKEKQAFVPNILFFGDDQSIDLNEEYGTKNKQYKVKGLIHIFNGYKFTITENTPLEEEVALDPELLGKVFENLLATYNPETKTTARKQTGSFYTPREIVNYMVDESLIAYLSNVMDSEDRLRRLFSPTDPGHDFTEEESRRLIEALSHCRILDPACGSGAFPMGILHRMVDLLKKLDPENQHWKEIQKERALAETKEAYDIGDQEERKHRLDEINKAFDESINNPDYARKLFLIQNCIYGVDIQQIAVQIAKLRFFISLVAEQKVDDSKPNRNILSMPNLETKFVAANTLIALEKPAGQLSLMSMNPAIEAKEKELKKIREKIFFTRRYHDKKQLKKEEKKCREELKKVLIDSNMSKTAAEQMAGWNPFDPLASSPYFDIETMFGFEGGFDVVIGNPPYGVSFKKDEKKMLKELFKTSDIEVESYILFIEKGLEILNNGNIITYIVPNNLLTNMRYEKVRMHILQNNSVLILVDLGSDVFDAAVDSCIFLFRKSRNKKTLLKSFVGNISEANNQSYNVYNQELFLKNSKNIFNIYSSKNELFTLEKIRNYSTPLRKFVNISRGIEFGYNSEEVFDIKISNDYKPLIAGRCIKKYGINFENKWIKFKESEPSIYKSIDIYLNNKILLRRIGRSLIASYDKDQYFNVCDVYNILSKDKVGLKYILGLINSTLLTFYLQNEFTNAKRLFPKIPIEYLELLPIKTSECESVINYFVDILLFIKKIKVDIEFFESIIDSIVYELYFPTEIQSAGCEVLKHLQHLPELKEGWDDEKKLAVIEQVYRELSDPQHPVSVAMEKMKQVEEVRIIEEAVKSSKGKGKS